MSENGAGKVCVSYEEKNEFSSPVNTQKSIPKWIKDWDVKGKNLKLPLQALSSKRILKRGKKIDRLH